MVEVALVAPAMCEVVEANGGVGVVGPQAGLADRQSALVQAVGGVQVALLMQDGGEVVEDGGGVGVVGTQAGLVDGKGALSESAGVGIPRPAVQVVRRTVQQVSCGQRLDLHGYGVLSGNQRMR